VEQNGKDKHFPEPRIFVVFGASGDLTKRKLLPALFHLRQARLLPAEPAVVGVARRDLSETFAADMKDGIAKGGAARRPIPGLIPSSSLQHRSKNSTCAPGGAGPYCLSRG
jgi:glucose-6-phosphate 1-dehydrogenase